MVDVKSVVFVVDDDPSVRRSLDRLLNAHGYTVLTFATAQEFLEHTGDDGPGCLLLDYQLPGLSGLDLQARLAEARRTIPIVFVSGHGDIPTSVSAMKGGALDFLTKPLKPNVLLDAVRRALEVDAQTRLEQEEAARVQERVALLTPREREVLALVAAGRLNKQVAYDLGITEKTVKVHRGRVMQKLGLTSLADLVRLAEKAGIRSPES